jgi:hypothetical protein
VRVQRKKLNPRSRCEWFAWFVVDGYRNSAPYEQAGSGFEVSHPFHKEREMDGAPNFMARPEHGSWLA